MKGTLMVLIAIAATMPWSRAAAQNPKIVVVNVDRIYVVSAMGQSLGKKLEAFEQKAQTEMKPKVDRANELQAKLRDAATAADQRPAMQRELETLATEIKRYQEDKSREAKILQDEGLKQIEAKLGPVLQKMAEENGWDVMLNKVPSVVIMAGPNADVTDQIIARFNKESPAN